VKIWRIIEKWSIGEEVEHETSWWMEGGVDE
jgi:hypothetical protein